jgi:pimeloyl-ACP methyl ester carboxylesterase
MTRSVVRIATGAVLLALAAGCARWTRPGPVPPSGEMEVDGGRLAYEVQGNGEPLVLVNGGGMDYRQWDRVVPELAQRFRVIRYDPRGWGRSPAATAPFSQAGDLRGLLNALGVKRAHVVGLSWGGGVAADFALSHPDRVDRLVLVGPAVGGYPWSSAFGERGRRFALAGDTPRVQLLLDDPWFSPGAQGDAELTAWIRGLLLENIRAFHLPVELERRLDPPAWRRLEEVRAPTLVVTPGRDHPDILAQDDSLARRIPGARQVMVPGAGHMLHIERPAEFNRIVAGFLEEG